MKLILCLFIVALCTYIGRLLAKKMAQRLAFFREYQAAVIYLADRIVGARLELIRALDGAQNEWMHAFFMRCANMLKTNPRLRFTAIWERCFDARGALTREDMAIVLEGGEAIEMLCRNPSPRQAEAYLRRIAAYIGDLENEKKKKCRLYNASGVLAGLFIALMVI